MTKSLEQICSSKFREFVEGVKDGFYTHLNGLHHPFELDKLRSPSLEKDTYFQGYKIGNFSPILIAAGVTGAFIGMAIKQYIS